MCIRDRVRQLVWLVFVRSLGFSCRLPVAVVAQTALADRHVFAAGDIAIDLVWKQLLRCGPFLSRPREVSLGHGP